MCVREKIAVLVTVTKYLTYTIEQEGLLVLSDGLVPHGSQGKGAKTNSYHGDHEIRVQ